ncbi:MAG: dihydropteroate synthase [Nitrospirae bacterium CG02_land_8_20_14_3_00_44_33]|nr:dihydropteroate synthase [Nitrospirota bacterium]PIV40428.1 MAG: dihydropteroate synthase [Nitrospirae bacterium CG02_land_8_20_14_3_00_44_33]PIV66530.1 MAG: dihydropteroate synthase [Nitrospirae bacterium CG01_land_8_20_14_3_00_44_22]PJA81589.1 MAG: dihydropteroate synthase [Nitrospirae bacterium CG_4_9_14_3_um_filter_44_28]
MKLTWQSFSLDFSKKTCLMGILNVTPDSFSDGGRHFDKASAIRRAYEMVEEGADIIDVGGESTRPGSEPVPLQEEIDRTIPVIEEISKKIKVPVSIDTYKAEVARRALDAGASIVNDISGLRFDPEMPKVVSQYKVPVVIMHIKGTPKDMQANPIYEALIPEITDYFRESIRLAVESGITEDKIIIDPGIGFGKTFDHNLEIIKNLREFTLLEKPLLVGVSRKAFIGKILGDAPVSERLEGSEAAAAISILNGANIIRVHDVKEMKKVALVADAIKRMSVN